ncbi:MAG TPA: SUF system Fe-S cluster assembly regulator [Acidobacteriota bacterium]
MSKLTDYGIVLLTYFANHPEGSEYSARQLAAETHLPLPMVGKILKLLAREGLLVSHRGASGGYRLARTPEKISVAEAIAAMEGPIAVMECIDAPGMCMHEGRCCVRGNWHKINATVVKALQGISLVDMTRPLVENFVPLGRLQSGPSPSSLTSVP